MGCYFEHKSRQEKKTYYIAIFDPRLRISETSTPTASTRFIHNKKYRLLEQLALLANRKKNSAGRLTKNSKIIKNIILAIQEKKGENIISLDLRKIPEAVADFFIICEAGSQPQVRAIADSVEDRIKNECDENPYRHEGYQAMQWVLIDYVNVVVHIMQPETRRFYKLEEMWSDAVLEEHDD